MQQINLNYNWKFNDCFKNEFLEKDFDDSQFESVNIPHNVKDIPYNYFDEEMYQIVSCYRKSFTADKTWQGKSVILLFEAVGHYAEVYINGQLAIAHKGGYNSFSVDIADMIDYDNDNTISVKVDSTERDDIPPFGNVIDYLCYGGIYREVYINVMEKSHIKHARIASYDVLNAPKIGVKLDFSTTAVGKASFTITDTSGTLIQQFSVDVTGKNSIDLKKPVDGINLWSIENPHLYNVTINYNNDCYSYKIGFREARFTAKGFFLNGKKIKILGLNRHQAFPYVGYAMPQSAQIADADFLKSLGLNLARTSHYPNSRHFLDRCDEIGLLVFTEIPGWQFVSKQDNWRETCVENVRKMIYDDYNHPSIILWGVRINESGDDDALYTATNDAAHDLDDTRQTSGVRCIPQSHLLEDVYSYNDFNHSGTNAGLMPKAIVCGSKAPLLISEHNGHMFPTKSFDHEKKRQAHALRHAKVVNDGYKRNNTCGVIGWCMSDYNTHKDFGSGDKICYHGVSDMFRIDKTAAAVYRSQQDEYAVLEIASNMEIGDVAGGKVGDVFMFTNCDSINLYKNDKLINTFNVAKLAKASPYKYMPHPPVLLYDTIGNQIEKDNAFGFSKHACKRLKKFLLTVKKYGIVPAIIKMPLTVLALMIRYKLGIDEFTNLFGQYATNWGDKSVSYKFEGIKGNQVIVNKKSACQFAKLDISADSITLTEKDTYDTTRIVLRALSQTGNVLPYDNSIITVTTEGDIEILGDTQFALIGGARAFWIKSNGISCDAKVIIKSNIGEETIDIKVVKQDVNAL